LARWAGAGQSAELFWRVTPREYLLVVRGVEERRRADLRLAQVTAYNQAILTGMALAGGRRIPKFERAFPDPFRERRAQSADEILAVMGSWVAATKSTARRGAEG
jgi:hypothetical protein